MIGIWTWFAGARVGRWIAGVALVIGALIAALFVAFLKGKHTQAKTDTAKDVQSLAEAAQAAIETNRSATQAAQTVRDDAAKEAPPDTVKRDDLNNTF